MYLILFLQPPNLLSSASLVPWAGKIPTSFVQGALGGFMRMQAYAASPGPVCHASRLNPMLYWAGLPCVGDPTNPQDGPDHYAADAGGPIHLSFSFQILFLKKYGNYVPSPAHRIL
jgi:hypothetical protein